MAFAGRVGGVVRLKVGGGHSGRVRTYGLQITTFRIIRAESDAPLAQISITNLKCHAGTLVAYGCSLSFIAVNAVGKIGFEIQRPIVGLTIPCSGRIGVNLPLRCVAMVLRGQGFWCLR